MALRTDMVLEVQAGLVVPDIVTGVGLRDVLVVGLSDVGLLVGGQGVGMVNWREMCEALALIDTTRKALVLTVALHMKPSSAKEDCLKADGSQELPGHPDVSSGRSQSGMAPSEGAASVGQTRLLHPAVLADRAKVVAVAQVQVADQSD
jgi:hypothetical protein